MSCKCNSSAATCDSDTSIVTSRLPQTKTTLRTNKDYTVEAGIDEVQIVANSTDPLARVKVTLPSGALSGQEVTVTAGADSTPGVSVFGSDGDTVAGSAIVDPSSATTYRYVAAADPCDPGQWVPTCCTEAQVQ